MLLKQIKLFIIFILIIKTFSVFSQQYSYADYILRTIKFNNVELQALQHQILPDETISDDTKSRLEKFNSKILPSDEINLDLLNVVILNQNKEIKKVFLKLNEIENKSKDSETNNNTFSNFCFLKSSIYLQYNIHLDSTEFEYYYSSFSDLQKFIFLYNVFCFENDNTGFVLHSKLNELKRLAQNSSRYDYLKTLKLIIDNNFKNWNYTQMNRNLLNRDSILNLIITNNFAGEYNPLIYYKNFNNSAGFKNLILTEKAISLNDLGYTARKNNKLLESENYLLDALKTISNISDKKNEALINSNLGITQTLNREFSAAESSYNNALGYYIETNDENKISEIKNLISKNHLLNSQLQLALNLCNQSLQTSTQNKDYKNMSDSYFLLSEIYSTENDFLESNKNLIFYNEFKKKYEDQQQKYEKEKLLKNLNYQVLNREANEEIQKEEQKKLAFLKLQLESNGKEKDLLVLKKEAQLREATIRNNRLEEDKARQALALIEEKLKNKKKEVIELERKNKINSLQTTWVKNDLLLSESRNKMLDQQKVINELKVKEINKNQYFLIFGLAFIIFSFGFVIFFFIRNIRHNKESNKKNKELTIQNDEISEQRNLIVKKNEEIIDSINYAYKIQSALLPTSEQLHRAFKDSFVYFKPKDIVSGDFYWIYDSGEYIFYATADCTGHGVPGGFMSMLGISLLNDIVKDKKIIDPCDVLDLMSFKIISELKQSVETNKSRDGMDLSLCRINKNKSELVFAGANNDLWLIRNDELIEYKADRQPVGYHFGAYAQFKQHSIEVKTGDFVFTFTDGYADQFGGVTKEMELLNNEKVNAGKKFKYKNLQMLLLANNHYSLDVQKSRLETAFEIWKGKLEQVDDILLLGIKI